MGHVFVSYSSQDEEFVNRLLPVLNEAGFETWVDREAIPGGAMWRTQIVEAINAADAVLLVLSPNSVNSDNVRKELDIADEAKKPLLPVEARRVIIPKDMAYQLAGLQKIDLETSFDRGVERLLEALRQMTKSGASSERPGEFGTSSESDSTRDSIGPAGAPPRSSASRVSGKPLQRSMVGEHSNAGAHATPQTMTLPREFATVWYRSGDKGTSFRAHSASGKLVVNENQVVFGEGDEAVKIGTHEIKSLDFGKMAGDLWNDWAVLRYGDAGKIAGFKDGSRLGWGKDTNLIYTVIKSVIEKQSGRSKR